MVTSRRSKPAVSLKLISGQRGGRAKTSVMPIQKGRASKVIEVDYFSHLQSLLDSISQSGLSLKMSQAYSAQTKAKRLSQLSTNSKRSGIWGSGFRATFSTRAYPTTESASSLLEVISPTIVTNSILTAANCLGIIRRERKAGRGGKMDPTFRRSLFQTLRFWYSVAEASGIPRQKAIAPRYVPKLGDIKEAIQIDQFFVARNLTWNECEKLMGFPEGWTVEEGDSLVTR